MQKIQTFDINKWKVAEYCVVKTAKQLFHNGLQMLFCWSTASTKMMSGNILGFTFKKFPGLKPEEENRHYENSCNNTNSPRKKRRESYVIELSKLLKNDGKETTVTDKVLF